MSETNAENLEERFDAGKDVLDYFDTDTIITTRKLTELSQILNLSAISREAGINVQTLQAKIRRNTALTGEETKRIVAVLKKYRLAVA